MFFAVAAGVAVAAVVAVVVVVVVVVVVAVGTKRIHSHACAHKRSISSFEILSH